MLRFVRSGMKVESKWIFLITGVALGVVVGRVSYSGAAEPPAKAASDVNRSAAVRGKSPTPATNAERLKSARLAQIREMGSTKDYKAREEFTSKLQPSDLPDLLTVFLADAGLEGIDYKQKEMLEKAVNQWVAEDIHAALSWAGNLPQTKLRRYFQNMMLGSFAKTDPFQAADLALEIEVGDEEFDASDIVSDGIRELCKVSGNERAIADLLRKTAVKDGKSSFGTSQTFAEDFSHQSLLASLVEIKNQGLEFRFAPTGMLEAWAKRDAEAAHTWSIAHGKVGFEEWQDVLSGVAATRGQQASGQWFLEKYTQADEKQRKMMTDAFDTTFDQPAARMALADSLARQMPPDLAGEFVDAVLREHLGTISDKQAEGLALLSWYPSAGERADVLVKHAGYGGVAKLLERFPESSLAPFGISRESLEAAFQRHKTSDDE